MKNTIKVTLLLCLILMASVLVFSSCELISTFFPLPTDTHPNLDEQTTPEETIPEETTSESHTHTLVLDSAVSPTCTETGLTVGTHCSICGYVSKKQEVVPALGHTWVVDEAVEPTCTTSGRTAGVHCSQCHEILLKQDVVSKLGHTEVIDAAVAATCTTAGLTVGKHCSVCNSVFTAQETIPALGHTWIVEEAVAPTCTEEGLTEGRYCSYCEYVEKVQEIAPALGHDWIVDEAVAPTCASTGLTVGVHCSHCCEILFAQETVNALDHNYFSTVVNPTATEDGYTNHTCSGCNETYRDSYVIPTNFTVTKHNLSMFAYNGENSENVVIPAVFQNNGTWYRVMAIEEGTFYGYSNLKSITLPFAGASLDPEADYCRYPFGYIFGTSSYAGSVATEQICHENGTNSGYICTFYIPASLTSVIITNGNIENDAFDNCSGLTSITFGNGVTAIDNTFWGCENLESITVDENNSYYSSIHGILYNKSITEIIYVPEKLTGTVTIPDSITIIPDRAFLRCGNITDVIIPDTVVSIGNQAFGLCTSLTNIYIPASVISIATPAFGLCNNMLWITVDENNPNYKSIQGHLYTKDGTTLLQYAIGRTNSSFTFPKSVIAIGGYSFADADNLTDITIPDRITSIGTYAFYDCDGFTNIVIPNGITNIAHVTFYNCDSFTSITIPNSVTSIDASAFWDCSNLTNITFIGTIQEWDAITKRTNWDNGIGSYVVYCTDGTIAKDGTVTPN